MEIYLNKILINIYLSQTMNFLKNIFANVENYMFNSRFSSVYEKGIKFLVPIF